jgi:hypothetical protein
MSDAMRSLLAAAVLAALLGSTAAWAEQRIFVIANNPDGYGVDRCLASGARCGSAAAAAYCRSQAFAKALSFRRVEKREITGAVPPAGRGCRGGPCEDFVAIECAR